MMTPPYICSKHQELDDKKVKGYSDSDLKVSVPTNQSDSKVLRSGGFMRIIESGGLVSHCFVAGLVSLLVIRLHNVIE